MSAQGVTYLEKAVSSVVAVLVLLATMVQSATLADSLPPTSPSSALSQPTLTTQLINGSIEGPRVLRLHKSCSEEHANFCENDGQCMYPQDTSTPSCICKPEYTGERCLFFISSSQSHYDYGEFIGVCVGVSTLFLALLIGLAFAIHCCVRRGCKKSGPLIKSHGSENSV